MCSGKLIAATALVVGWLSAAGPFAIAPASADEAPVSLALSGGRLLDGFGGAPLEDAVILISGERIVAVGAAHELAVPDGVPVIDTNGMTMLPGLWESHGHLFHVGEADPGAFQARFAETLPAIMQAVARVSIEAGITAYRDFCTRCASEAEGWRSPLLEAQQDLERRILAGEVPGPRLFLSGPILQPVSRGH